MKPLGPRSRPHLRLPALLAVLLLLLAGAGSSRLRAAAPDRASEDTLRPAAAFAGIEDEAERSAALFQEAAKVLTHPRCVNCHPAGDAPLQGPAERIHEPPVRRGTGGFGVVGMECSTCHRGANFDPGRVPGAPHWHLAPRGMAWEGESAGAICEQLKDPARNGRRTLEEVVEHMREDELVGWGWAPGAGRAPAPGTQQIAADLLAAWAATGAVCPP
jgi:hypothetical protein